MIFEGREPCRAAVHYFKVVNQWARLSEKVKMDVQALIGMQIWTSIPLCVSFL